MDYKFLNKVVDQIISETRINYDRERVYTSSIFPSYPFYVLTPTFYPLSFSDHCKDIYGIKDEQEIKYVWNEYMKIIKGKIKS